MDLLVYLNAQSSAVDFMTNVLHMADHTTPAATVMAEMMTNFKPIGSHTQHICEATDILYADPAMDPVDGQSGDVNYPYGDIKVLLTPRMSGLWGSALWRCSAASCPLQQTSGDSRVR